MACASMDIGHRKPVARGEPRPRFRLSLFILTPIVAMGCLIGAVVVEMRPSSSASLHEIIVIVAIAVLMLAVG